MPYPTKDQVYSIFLNLRDPPNGTKKFFAEVDDNVRWQISGSHKFSQVWNTKESYYKTGWCEAEKLLEAPGFKLEVIGGKDEVIVSREGQAAVEMKAVDTWTKKGKPYEQHYSWHVRFNPQGKIVDVKIFLDSGLLERTIQECDE